MTPRFHHLLAAEWLKLRSLRSTPWALAVSALAIVGANSVSARMRDGSANTCED